MKKTQDFGDISYHQYPKIYFEAIKGLTKSLVVKKQIDIDTKISECIKEYKKILKQMGYENIKDETEHFINFATKLASWYEMKFPDPKTHNIFLNKDLKLTPEFFTSPKDPYI